MFDRGPGPEEFPHEYCIWCCHFHDCDVECGQHMYDGTIQGDICMCVSTLESRIEGWATSPNNPMNDRIQ